MQRLVKAIAAISLVILLTFFLIPIKLDTEKIIKQNLSNDELVSNMGLDPSKLLHSQKKIIKSENLSYLREFKEDSLIAESVNPYLFQRTWSVDRFLLDYEGDSTIDTAAYLFIDPEGNYHVMYNYRFKLLKNDHNHFTLDFSRHHNLQLVNYETYLIYKDKEYYSDVSYNFNLNEKKFFMPIPHFSQYFKYPSISGFYHFQFLNIGEYESSFFSLVIKTYDYVQKQNNHIVLGFNSFRNNPNDLIRYVPTSLSIIYKEDN